MIITALLFESTHFDPHSALEFVIQQNTRGVDLLSTLVASQRVWGTKVPQWDPGPEPLVESWGLGMDSSVTDDEHMRKYLVSRVNGMPPLQILGS